MRVSDYSFGSVRVDGVTYDHDLIIDRGKIRKRNKAGSRRFRGEFSGDGAKHRVFCPERIGVLTYGIESRFQ